MAKPTQDAYDREGLRLNDVRNQVPSIIGAPHTIDAWRQRRMYELVSPIIEACRDLSWLTIGDSGGDASFLKSCGVVDVTASSITTDQLSALQEKGQLTGIRIASINAEDIDRGPETVDIVYCKEAYHHLPRPAVGLYEMLRVARRCVILCEPSDHGHRPLDWLRIKAKSLLRGQAPDHQIFEPVGNYVFGLSERETTKIATALCHGPLFFRRFSDFYHPGLSAKPFDAAIPRVIAKLGIGVQDGLSRLRLMSHARICAVIWKIPPPAPLSRSLQGCGFRRVDVQRNPYTLDNLLGRPDSGTP